MRECYQQYLNDSPKLTSLMCHSSEVPDFAWRFKANINLIKKYFPHSEVFIMDSSPAVVLGTMLDPTVPNGAKTVINIGNGHSLAMVLDNNWNIIAIWEHHTGSFQSNPDNFDYYLQKLYKDELTHEDKENFLKTLISYMEDNDMEDEIPSEFEWINETTVIVHFKNGDVLKMYQDEDGLWNVEPYEEPQLGSGSGGGEVC